ncbi:MAG: GerA spore germination protein, partial [Paenibacillus sp.]|nr:GerA spore germination protein [Paenibacillus sp.]
PYLTPVSPVNIKGIEDVFLRMPWWKRSDGSRAKEAGKRSS